ncbi:MAG: aromatic ring-hydroxylating dioxygenase subunit alpha [Hyphomonadaceae bacterium]
MIADLERLIEDDRERGIFRVNRRVFTDEDVLAAEQRFVFDRCWLYCGHESELRKPGSFLTRKVGGRPLILTRDPQGALHAFLNSCPHRGNVVCREKAGTTKLFTCFYHAWSFGTDGALAGLPGDDAYSPAWDRQRMGLKPVPRFESYRGLMFVSFDAEIVDLVTYLGDARDRLDCCLDVIGDEVEIVAGQQSYSMRANWKLLVENSFDGYHAISTHQRYFRTYLPDIGMPPPDPNFRDGKAIVNRGFSLGRGHAAVEGNFLTTPITMWAKDELADIRKKLETRVGRERAAWVSDYNRNLLIFPNLILISLWNTIRTFYPVSPDYMEIDAWALFPPSESAVLRQKRLENFLSFLGPAGFATPDDVSGLEGCQRGFATRRELEYSDISRGMLSEEPSGFDELQMRAFWRQWRHQMGGGEGAADCGDRSPRLQAAE